MLYVARHGETDWNVHKRFQARTDVPLNETGRAQARALRRLLDAREVGLRAVRCSPLSRAVETARIVLQGQAVDLLVEPALIELALGDYEGRLEADIRLEQGVAYDAWRDACFSMAAPGGESLAQGMGRVRPVLEQLREVARTGDVLIVAHQAINIAIKATLSGLLDVDIARSYRQANDEVDVWDMDAGVRVERLKVQAVGG